MTQSYPLIPKTFAPEAQQINSTPQGINKSKVNVSNLNVSEMNKINYIDKLDSANFSSDYKANLINLMNMGFMDFNKNLTALQKNFNNLELTCSHIINEY